MFAINEFGSFSMADSIMAIASSWAPFWLWKSAKEDKKLELRSSVSAIEYFSEEENFKLLKWR